MFVLCATMQWWRLLAAEGRARRVAEAALRSKAEAEARVSLSRGVEKREGAFAAQGGEGGLPRPPCAARQRHTLALITTLYCACATLYTLYKSHMV